MVIRALFFYGLKLHRGIVRHTSMEDALLIFKSVSGSTLLIYFLAKIGHSNIYLNIPISIIAIDY
jgi:FlaA1/EpsC-like NDP-sugar epimerase